MAPSSAPAQRSGTSATSCPARSIGERCNLGQNVVVMPGTRIGNNVKIQNNVSIYEGVTLEDDVFCGPSCVFTNVINPRSHVSAKGRVQGHAGAARGDDRRQCDGDLRQRTGPVLLRRGWSRRHERCTGLCARRRSSRQARRLDVHVWSAAPAGRRWRVDLSRLWIGLPRSGRRPS